MFDTPYGVDIARLNGQQLEIYLGKVTALPSSIGKILAGFSTAEFIEDVVGKKFNLNEKQKQELCRIIRDILLVEVFVGEMAGVVGQRLNLANDVAVNLAELIIDDLLQSALTEIRNMHEQKFKKAWLLPTQAQATTSPTNTDNIIDLRN